VGLSLAEFLGRRRPEDTIEALQVDIIQVRAVGAVVAVGIG